MFKIRLAFIVLVFACGIVCATDNYFHVSQVSDGWEILFDGNSTEKWVSIGKDKFPEKGWIVEDGTLVVNPVGKRATRGGGAIITRDVYDDFDLRVDFKITEGANSGIKYFVSPEHAKARKELGLEFQILDDAKHPDAKKGRSGNRTISSLYDLIPAKDKVVNPVGKWNSARVVSKGKHVEHWLNGKKVVEFDRDSKEFAALVASSKYKKIKGFGLTAKGHILLQDHSDTVSFKNIMIKTSGVKFPMEKLDHLRIHGEGEKLTISAGSVDLLAYQQHPMANPVGGDKFKGSNFIHPLKTPSGFVITDLQPSDHLHHFGLWWPWKYLKVEGRKVLMWELQQGEGIIEAQGVSGTKMCSKEGAGFEASSHYIDKTAPDGPKVVLNEKLKVNVSPIVKSPAAGYFLDLTITHSCAVNSPIEIVKYRYSGFCIRTTANWTKDNSTLLTSLGKELIGSNFTRAHWVRAEGDADNGNKAGFVMMSHPENRDTPQLLRTWDESKHGATFINFNPVQEKPWNFEPGKNYTQKYRLFVYDGTITSQDVKKLWSDYAELSNSK